MAAFVLAALAGLAAGAAAAAAAGAGGPADTADTATIAACAAGSRAAGGNTHCAQADRGRRSAPSGEVSTTADPARAARTVAALPPGPRRTRTRLKPATRASGIQPSSSILARRNRSRHRLGPLK